MASMFVEGVPIIQIRRSNVHITFVAPESITICIALADFRAAVAKARRTLAEHDAKSAKVIPIRGKRPRH